MNSHQICRKEQSLTLTARLKQPPALQVRFPRPVLAVGLGLRCSQLVSESGLEEVRSPRYPLLHTHPITLKHQYLHPESLSPSPPLDLHPSPPSGLHECVYECRHEIAGTYSSTPAPAHILASSACCVSAQAANRNKKMFVFVCVWIGEGACFACILA
jgi:hypothetical protein